MKRPPLTHRFERVLILIGAVAGFIAGEFSGAGRLTPAAALAVGAGDYSGLEFGRLTLSDEQWDWLLREMRSMPTPNAPIAIRKSQIENPNGGGE